MKPKTVVPQAPPEHFRVELERLMEAGHPRAKPGRQIHSARCDEWLRATRAAGSPASQHAADGSAALPTDQHGLADEAVVQDGMDNSYQQHCGGQ